MHLSNHLFNENKKPFLVLIVLFLIILVVGETVRAQVPNTLNYQGVLTGSNGKPVTDGQYQLTFKLYDQATGGSAIWSETQNTTTTNGIFSVLLGKVTSLTDVPFDKPYWLGITVSNGSEMTPRVPLSASAYSLGTRSLDDSVKVFDLDISNLLWATVGSSSSGYLSLKIDAPDVLTSDVINNWVVLVYVQSTDFGYWAPVPYYTERGIRVTANVQPGYVVLKRDQDGQPITQSNFSAVRLVLINPVTFSAIN